MKILLKLEIRLYKYLERRHYKRIYKELKESLKLSDSIMVRTPEDKYYKAIK